MSKTRLICFRVDDSERARIEAAANSRGQSLTTFIKDSIIETVQALETESGFTIKPRHRHQGITVWLRSLCEEATKGGALGFREVGDRFSASIHREYVLHSEHGENLSDEWGTVLKELNELLAPALRYDPGTLIENDARNEKVWSCVKRHFADATERIPTRRVPQFLLGIYTEVWGRGRGKPLS